MMAETNSRRSVSPRLKPGLEILQEAWDLAHKLQQDPWQCAVEIDVLRSAGVSQNDVRWLLSQGLLREGHELTRPNDRRRRFREVKSLAVTDHACFVLTDDGYQYACESADRPIGTPKIIALASLKSCESVIQETAGENCVSRQGQTPQADCTPTWDSTLHELRVGDSLVKRFSHPAPSQELILTVFQEEGWPPAIDDPLPGQFKQDPKRRLHYTIQNLNRAQGTPGIHFFINGNGQSIRWRLLGPIH
ncbi:MAG: hypothetical protein ACKV0T_15340 [Planctomycetales bacterium]